MAATTFTLDQPAPAAADTVNTAVAATPIGPTPRPGAHRDTAPPATTCNAGAAVAGGAVKMQSWYIDTTGRRVRTVAPVPVDADDARTPHLRFRCPHRITPGATGRRCEHAQWLLPTQVRYCPEHGAALAAPPTPSTPRRKLLREARRLHARSAVPWALLGVAAAADVGVHLAHISALTIGGFVPVAATGAALITRTRLTRRARRRGRLEPGQRQGRRVRAITRTAWRASGISAGTTGWLALAAGTDPTTWAGQCSWGVLVLGWALASRPWWLAADARRARITAGQSASVPGAPVVTDQTAGAVAADDPVRAWALERWASRIGCSSGPLAGTHLEEFTRMAACPDESDRRRLPNWSARVVANKPGAINMRENRPHLLGRIAAAYRCTYADVSFAADEGDVSVAWVRVQPDNVLAQPRLWPGPKDANDWTAGRSIIGRFDDGQPMSYWWWNSIGAVHDLVSGCTGSGKSELVVQLLLDSLHSHGLVLDWVGDPQGGQSYGAIKDSVDWFARSREEIVFLLLAAKKEMLRRNDAMSAANIKTWQVSRDMPLLVITLDEVQSYIEDAVVLQLVEDLVGQGRKCGIKLRLITQVPAAYNLGGSIYIKEQLRSGQTFIGRAITDVAGRLAVDGDCPVDPTMIPAKWGEGTCQPGQTTAGLIYVQGIGGRDVYGRADWTGHDMSVWLADDQGRPTVCPGVFGPAAADVSGVLWGDRKARAAAALAAGRSDADLLPGGKALDLIRAAAVTTPTGVLRLAPQPSTVGRSSARDVVLDAAHQRADQHGTVTRDDIIAATRQLNDNTRNKALTDLVAEGKLRRVRNGVFEVPHTTSVAC